MESPLLLGFVVAAATALPPSSSIARAQAAPSLIMGLHAWASMAKDGSCVIVTGRFGGPGTLWVVKKELKSGEK